MEDRQLVLLVAEGLNVDPEPVARRMGKVEL